MSLRLGRLGGLADLDPLAVPLPAGTEVTTRVDRTADGRVVGQGALGRVVGLDGDQVDVEVVGVGRVRYLRDEVAPRKLGQVRYAQRRHDAWAQLAPTLVVDTVVGSRAWGLASETSDTDRRGVFVLPLSWQTGLVDPPLDLGSADGSHAYWEIGKAIRQALRADPNTLEMLFACGGGDVKDEMGGWLIEIRDAFSSVEIYGSFGRYALSQLDRLEHNLRLSEHRTLVLGWLAEADPGLDATATRLATSAHVAAPTPAAAVQRARDYLKQLYRSLFDQGLLAANEWSALVDFARSGGAALTAPRELGPKNAYNLIRLLDLAIRWLTAGGDPELRVRDELRPTLLAIKRGEVAMADVVAMARALTPQLEAARSASPLPPRADIGRAEAVLRRVRHEAARRFLAGAPGPWGHDAPPPPAAQFDPPMSDILTQIQSTTARGFLAEQSLLRRHLVVYLSGAHAYGFPSPDSDLDLKCIHVAATRELVGLFPSEGGADSMVVRDGVEIDYGSNELGPVLRGVLKGNGNFIERILGELVLDAEYERLAELQPLVRAALSRRVHRHYRGFAHSQLEAATESPTAKRVLYVLRTALTGSHLLASGELVTDLTVLAPRHQLDVRELIAIKQRGEKTPLTGDDLARWRGEIERVLAGLDAALAGSRLPEEPPARAVADLERWLVVVRRAEW